MGVLNVLRTLVGIRPIFENNRCLQDDYTYYGRDNEGYFFMSEDDHPDP